jgi:hypothetical protein
MSYKLQPLTADEAARWDDLISPYESRQLFHRRAWLDYLAASHNLDIRLWVVRDARRTVGYFCGGVLRKGPFRILGSPLKGWGTNFMGPVVNSDFDQSAFLASIDDLAARESFAMVELETPVLSGSVLNEAGYEPLCRWSYLVELTPENPDKMWKRLEQRSQVRKALKLGLTAEDTSDPAIVDKFYQQTSAVFARKNLAPPYSREVPRALFSALKPKGMLFAMCIRDADGNVVATGLFPHDDRELIYWGGASLQEALPLAPNDLMHWTAMEMGARLGLRSYNMSGNGFFKKKFGGCLQETKRWHKFYSKTARWAYWGYDHYFTERNRLEGLWNRVVRSRG